MGRGLAAAPILSWALLGVGSGLLGFRDESPLSWHAFGLLAQYGTGVYAILMLEGSTRGGLMFRLGITAALLVAQLTSRGLVVPLLLYFIHLLSRLPSLLDAETDGAASRPAAGVDFSPETLAVLPTVVLAHLVPHFNSFLGAEERRWWDRAWQLFPVWGLVSHLMLSAGFAAVPGLAAVAPAPLAARMRVNNRLKATRVTALCLGIVGAGTHRYAAAATDPHEALGTLHQLDYVAVFGSTLTWLACQMGDLKHAGLVSMSWRRMALVAVPVAVVFGPASLCWLGWMAREEVLASWESRRAERGADRKDR